METGTGTELGDDVGPDDCLDDRQLLGFAVRGSFTRDGARLGSDVGPDVGLEVGSDVGCIDCSGV